MKRIISNLMLVAVAAAAFFSCQKHETFAPEISEVSGLIFTSEKPSFVDDTKTEWTGETIQWSAKDKIRVAYTCNNIWQNADGSATADEENGKKTAKIYESSQIPSAATVANFTVPGNFKNEESGVYEFYGIYPAIAVTSPDMKYAPSVTVEIPSGQIPLASSFDSKADLMVSKSNEYLGIPKDGDSNGTISLKWDRLVAHADITLTNLGVEEGEVISMIKLTADEDADMVGSHYLYLDTYNVVLPNNNTPGNVLTIDASNLTINSGSVNFWLCFLPCTWKSLDIVVETDKATYARSINLTEAKKEKTFKKNARNILSINMFEAKRTEKVTTATAELDFTIADNRTEFSTEKQVWESNGITIVNDKASSQNDVADYVNPARFYAKSTITISAPGNISKIEFTCSSTSYATALKNSISGSVANSDKVTVSLDGTSKFVTYTLSAQVRMKQMIVTYASTGNSGDSGDTPETPVKPTKLNAPEVTCSESDITENSLKFTWNAVANASKYEVTFDNGTPTETTNTYYEATGLNANTNYSISVKAVGDGVNYETSEAGIAEGTTKESQQSGGGDDTAMPITVSNTIAKIANANGWVNSKQYKSFKLDDVITVSAVGGANTGKYYNSGTNWRIYQNENPTLTISADEAYTIKTVKVSYVAEKTGVLTYNKSNIASETVVNVNAQSITFGVGNTSASVTNGQVRVTAIEVVYENN